LPGVFRSDRDPVEGGFKAVSPGEDDRMDRKERIARNEALFRVVNERVREVSREDEGLVGFLCECGDEACTETVSLPVGKYAEVRADPTRFVVVPGHEIEAVESVVRRRGSFLVVRKHPEEAATAIETDPRA
jgi:hypothetical protein